MTLSLSSTKEVATTRTNEETYFLPVDFELIHHIYLISQEFINSREVEEEDYQDNFEPIEIEYSISSFAEGY